MKTWELLIIKKGLRRREGFIQLLIGKIKLGHDQVELKVYIVRISMLPFLRPTRLECKSCDQDRIWKYRNAFSPLLYAQSEPLQGMKASESLLWYNSTVYCIKISSWVVI